MSENLKFYCKNAMVVMEIRKKSEPYGKFYKPQKLLTQLVTSGKLGKKSGTGFYSYTWSECSVYFYSFLIAVNIIDG